MSTEITAFPLCWPPGRKRTPQHQQKHAQFSTSFAKARDNVVREIARLKGARPVLSTNLPLRNDGLPYANRGPANNDSGVAVYFMRNGRQLCFACDAYYTLDDNMHAIGLTIAALRGIARWGTGDMMEAAFTGFAALPEKSADSWWIVLGVDHNATVDQVRAAYTALVKTAHPDAGGNNEDFIRVQAAWDEFKRATLCGN